MLDLKKFVFRHVQIEHTLKAPSLINITEDGIEIFVNDVHSAKEYLPILIRQDGISIYFNNEHPLNAYLQIFFNEWWSIIVTISEISISVNDWQFWKQKSPINVNEEWNSILVKDDHPSNALFSIRVTKEGAWKLKGK